MRNPFAPADPTSKLRPQWLTRLLHPARLGTLRRVTPLSNLWGYDRGEPVDRYYIENFLDRHSADIRGHVLEVKDSKYSERFGTGITARDVLDIDPANPRATIIADLANAHEIPSDRFDCCMVTQTLQYIYELEAAVIQLHRILKPGGVLLATVPALSRIDRTEFGDYWRLTPAACMRLIGRPFGEENVAAEGAGNVLTAMAMLTGMAQQDLSAHQLEANDPDFPVICTIRAVKAVSEPAHSASR